MASALYMCVCVCPISLCIYVFGQETLSSKLFQLAIIISVWSDSSNVVLFHLKANTSITLSPINIRHKCLAMCMVFVFINVVTL